MQAILYFQSPSRTSAPEKLAGVQEVAARLGWHVQILEDLPDPEKLDELIAFWRPLGAIVECGGGMQEIDVRPFSRLPTVFLDRNPATLPDDVCCVYHDGQATAAMAARELLSSGYSHFAYVHPFRQRFWADQREEGFRRALKLNGRSPSVLPPVGSDDSVLVQRRLRAFLEELPKPCAVFAANDQTAAGVLAAAAALELETPNALAVLGVDNYAEICERTRPSLSSIEPDFRGGGQLAARLLHALLTESVEVAERQRTFGPLRIVRRASTRLLKVHDREVECALARIRNEACLGLTAGEVAAGFSCSRGRAEIRFRAATGRSILEEIHAVRLGRAKELLMRPRMQLKTIHAFCGFSTPCALQKFFRQRTGCTLTEWRKSRLNPPDLADGRSRSHN